MQAPVWPEWWSVLQWGNRKYIREIRSKKNYKKIRDLIRDWKQISHSNHYTRMFSVLVWDCNWIYRFMDGWFCSIRLNYLHVIGRKSLHFEKINLKNRMMHELRRCVIDGKKVLCTHRISILLIVMTFCHRIQWF